MAFSEKDVSFYGFTPVPRDPDVLFKDHPTASGDNPKQDLFEFKDIPLPDSPLVQKVKTFVKVRLLQHYRSGQVTQCSQRRTN